MSLADKLGPAAVAAVDPARVLLTPLELAALNESTETVEDGIVVLHDDDTHDEIGSSTDDELGGGRRSLVKSSNVDPTRKNPVDTCAGCGPVPDPWANGPVPDPWSDPSSSSSSSSSGSSTSSGGSTSSSSGGNKH